MQKKQSSIFLETEGDSWFKRNLESMDNRDSDNDVIYLAVKKIFNEGLNGKEILEVGCSKGYRLNWFRKEGAVTFGFDPSESAIFDGKKDYGFNENELFVSDSASFFAENEVKFDVIIFGHSLYLVDPKDIPKIVSGAFNSLREGGFIVIFDFDSEPQRQEYHHLDGVYSFKARFDSFFTWIPQMILCSKEVREHKGSMSMGDQKEDCALSIIRKVPIKNAFLELTGDINI